MQPYYRDELTTLYYGDFREAMEAMPADSVDCIATDPPYLKEFVPLYGQMAQQAARVLVPSGSLLALTPHYHLPRILVDMTPHLTYRWLCAMWQADGSHARFPGRGWSIRIMWKPLVWWTKGAMPNWLGRVGDGFVNVEEGKQHHEWQQSSSWADYCLRWVPAGGVVLDPFVGSGTMLLAARAQGIRSIGVEMSERHCETTANRLSQTAMALL